MFALVNIGVPTSSISYHSSLPHLLPLHPSLTSPPSFLAPPSPFLTLPHPPSPRTTGYKHIEKIQLLSHQYKIAATVCIFIYTHTNTLVMQIILITLIYTHVHTYCFCLSLSFFPTSFPCISGVFGVYMLNQPLTTYTAHHPPNYIFLYL